MRAGVDLDTVVDLVELAVTWDELDYGDADLIPPYDWLEFWSDHPWPDPDVARRLFSAAVDIARTTRASDSARPRSTAPRPL